MSLAHSPIGASGAARRIQCPGSVRMQDPIPDARSPGDDSEQGDAAHWGLARRLAGEDVQVNDRAPNGLFLTDEMLEAIDLCYERLAAVLAVHGLRTEQGAIEKTLAGPRIHPQAFGTPDFRAWAALPGGRYMLVLLDFKFGHRYVEVFENAQLIDYTAYCLTELDRMLGSHVDDRLVNVEAIICQPRSYHRDGPFRTWKFCASDIRAHINTSSNSAHEALGPNPRTCAGPECRDCRAQTVCETRLRSVQTTLDDVGGLRTVELGVNSLAPMLRQVYAAQKSLEAYATALEESVYAAERRGVAVPGIRTQVTYGREVWSTDTTVEMVRLLGEALGKPFTIEKPITPTQARKAGVPDAVVLEMSVRPKTGVSLVIDDGREARKIFG